MNTTNQYYWYVRISGSAEQRNRNLSIPSQIEQLRMYEQKNPEIQITKIYEEIHSAFKWGKRPVFHQMIESLQENPEIKGIIVFKRDRISRNPDDYLYLQNVRWWKGKLDVISISEPMINSYLGRYMIRDLQNRSILYSEELSFRVRLGHRKKLQMGWYPYTVPFWYKKVQGRLYPRDELQEIVKYIFEQYATGRIGIKALTKKTQEKYSDCEIAITKSKIESMLNNTIYYWTYTAERELTKEDYMLFWADAPWKLIEEFQIETIEPLITKQLYEDCQRIREYKKVVEVKPKHRKNAKFPKTYYCWCGRTLRRYDRRWVRYLFCPKLKSKKHSTICHEGHIPLKKIDDQMLELVKSIIPSKEQREQAKKWVQQENRKDSKSLNEKLTTHLASISKAEGKLQEIEGAYLNSELDKETYFKLRKKLSTEHKQHTLALQHFTSEDTMIQSRKKIVRFMDILETREKNLADSQWSEKSSRVYMLAFKACVNIVITRRNISNYQLFPLFDLCKVHSISIWQRESDLNW